jgi:putative oxidoreductase
MPTDMTPPAAPGRPGTICPALARLYRPFEPFAWPAIRIAAGACLVPHGAQKMFGAFGGRGLAATMEGFGRTGFEPGWLWGSLVAGTEFFGGLLIALGLLTRPAAFAAAVLMAVALTRHLDRGFFWGQGGWEYPAMWLVVLAAIAVRGGGRFSLDRAIGREF